jgi:4-amino-4-deoxy-L-arabinose transferase-like glycosyltransferase
MLNRQISNATRSHGLVLLLALTAALLFLRLHAIPLVGPDEPRYARVAAEMKRSGDWITPTLGGEPWLEKPVLYYWMASSAMKHLEETELAARLPSVLALIFLVGVTAWFGRRLFGVSAGLHAGFILATSLLTHVYGRAASMDMLVAAPVTASLGLILLRLNGAIGPTGIAAAYALMGIACLAKGPLGVLLPALVVVAHLATLPRESRRQALGRLWSPLGALLFALAALPWYLAILWAQGQSFLKVFLLNHNIQRFTSEIHSHPGSVVYYLPILLLGLFPWSWLIFPALAAWRPIRSEIDRFLALWLLAPLAFFSLAGSKLPGYILPCVPPLALLIGRYLASPQPEDHRSRWALKAGFYFHIALGLLLAASPLALDRYDSQARSELMPLSLLALLSTIVFALGFHRGLAWTARTLRASMVAILVVVSLIAPSILDRMESGRRIFWYTACKEVVVWGAPRSAWMSGYFYNEGRVRLVYSEKGLRLALHPRNTLVFCGPEQCREVIRSFANQPLRLVAKGPGGSMLIKIKAP